MVCDPAFFAPAADGLRLAVRLQPAASANRIDGPARLDDGQVVLKVRVTEVPEKGRANRALIRLLAKTWRLPKSTFRLAAGSQDRRKLLAIQGDPAALSARIEDWCRQEAAN